jgi:5-methylcytosine-specific restriction endonuclease McrA
MQSSRHPSTRRRPHIPAAVRRTVWERDGGRCQWPAARGGICGSTLRAELDHVTPLALGGASTLENLRVLCSFHNRLAARASLGDAVVDAYARRTRSSRQPNLFAPGALPVGG